MSQSTPGHRPVVNIIGAGIGGLTVAAYLARQGAKVRLFEARPKVGGVVHSFHRGAYRFEASTHQLGGFGEIGYMTEVARHLGLDLHLERAPHLYESVYLDGEGRPEARVLLPSQPEALEDELVATFPDEALLIRSLLANVAKIGGDVLRLKQVLRANSYGSILLDAVSARLLASAKGSVGQRLGALRYRHMVRFYNRTWDDLLAGMSTELRSVVSQHWAYAGTPPSECPALLMAIILYVYLHGGPYQVRGGTSVLIDQLTGIIEQGGGEILTRTPVERIVLEHGRAVGVVARGGELFRADRTVSNINSQRTLLDMVGRDHLPQPFATTVADLRMSRSIFQVYVGARLLPEAHGFKAHTTFFNTIADLEEASREAEGGPGERTAFLMTNHSQLDATAAPEGASSFVVAEFDEWHRWTGLTPEQYAAQKEATQELILDKLERATGMPVRRQADKLFSATPRTINRYSSARQGEIYGPAALLSQCFSNRTPTDSPVPGLHMVGAYSQPAHGVSSIMDAAVILGTGLAKELL